MIYRQERQQNKWALHEYEVPAQLMDEVEASVREKAVAE